MATTRKTTTRTRKPSSRSTSRRAEPSLAERTERTIARRPYASAAVATGAVAAIAALAAGAFFFRRSDKSLGEFTDDVGERVKDGLSDAQLKAKSAARGIRQKASALFGSDDLTQDDLAAEALTLKQTGRKAEHPVDDTIEQELKTGAVSY